MPSLRDQSVSDFSNGSASDDGDTARFDGSSDFGLSLRWLPCG